MLNITDTHSHIYLEEFDADRQAMLERAGKEGVNRIIMPAIDSATHEKMIAVEKENAGLCRSMMGLHPCSVKENYKDELAIVKDWLGKRSFEAVGEIGLDFYWDLSFKDQQYESFRKQIEWALEFKVPIVIHSRNSIDECIAVVEEYKGSQLTGVFHCFSGTVEQANRISGLGFYLGIGGVVTFKKSGLDEVMKKISLEHVVLETDAPYLAPVPFRGKRNEPAYLKYVLQKLHEIHDITIEEIAHITTRNASNLFGKKEPQSMLK